MDDAPAPFYAELLLKQWFGMRHAPSIFLAVNDYLPLANLVAEQRRCLQHDLVFAIKQK